MAGDYGRRPGGGWGVVVVGRGEKLVGSTAGRHSLHEREFQFSFSGGDVPGCECDFDDFDVGV